MIKASFTDYISKCKEMVVRYVVATWPATRSHAAGRMTVYREFENGKKQVRRLCYHTIAGWQSCLMVFIADENGKPVATAEILPGGRLGQFYGNELYRDPAKMEPSKDAEMVVSKWLKKLNDSNIKIKPRKEAA